MTKQQKHRVLASAVLILTFGVAQNVNAMHIMEGYLPGGFCIAWGVICLPFLWMGFRSIRKSLNENRRVLPLLAMAGAFIFVISSLKIPSVTGSCSHMTGTGLGALLFGPGAVSILGLIVLLFQAILLAHGGLTTLGANVFSMAVAGPFVSYGIYRLCQKGGVNKRLAVFLAAAFRRSVYLLCDGFSAGYRPSLGRECGRSFCQVPCCFCADPDPAGGYRGNSDGADHCGA